MFTLFFFLTTVFLFFRYGTDLPNYEQLANYKPSISSRFFADDGSLLTEYATEKRIYLELHDIPENVSDAFISAEDRNFYKHFGLDFKAIARAMLGNIKTVVTGGRSRPKGASTITQQVSKNFFLTSEISIARKIKEMILALKIERTFTKDYILTLYLNKIYLGYYSYGVAAAAHNYFDKSLDQLTLGEAAFLAALPKAPNNYNPVTNKEKAIERRNWVLGRMLVNEKITKAEYDEAVAEDLIVSNKFNNSLQSYSMYFSEEVRKTVSNQFSNDILYQEGFSVWTTMDPELQKQATISFRKGILGYDKAHGFRGPLGRMTDISDWRKQLTSDFNKPGGLPKGWNMAVVLSVSATEAEIGLSNDTRGKIVVKGVAWARGGINAVSQVLKVGDVILVEKQNDETFVLQQNPKVNGAMVVMDPHSGKVLAMVGGFSYEQSKFNRVTQAQRQIGSTIKPFIYMTALAKDEYSPFSILLDAPIVMERGDGPGLWKPENYERTFKGNLTLRQSLELSRNTPTIRLANELGIPEISETFKRFGLYNKDLTKSGLSIALGTGETTLMKVAGAFSTFPNGGIKINPYFIEKVQDRDGNIIFKNDKRICGNCGGENSSADDLPMIAEIRERIVDPQTNYQIISILKGVVQAGSGTPAKIDGAYLAGKTGTSSDNKDAWFIGFSDKLLVGIYVGYDRPEGLGRAGTGSTLAAPIFKDFMLEALKAYPSEDFEVPSGITFIRLNKKDGTFAASADEPIVIEAVKDSEMGNILKRAEIRDEKEQIIGGRGVVNEQNYDASVGGLY
ncbi:MAG: PBP1A family penicillin-binding protein [Rickettsiales bacterium]|nr:PBP1A family penicillin-binding protein [Rickettsiales bacterium]